jgi:hypothetical protein
MRIFLPLAAQTNSVALVKVRTVTPYFRRKLTGSPAWRAKEPASLSRIPKPGFSDPTSKLCCQSSVAKVTMPVRPLRLTTALRRSIHSIMFLFCIIQESYPITPPISSTGTTRGPIMPINSSQAARKKALRFLVSRKLPSASASK